MNLMDSALQFSVVSSDSLVSTNSNGDGQVGSDDLSLNLGDRVSDSGSSGGVGETVAKSSIAKSSIAGETITIVGVEQGWVSLGFPLAEVVVSGRDKMGVVASHLGGQERTGSDSQRPLAGIIDLSVESRGSKESGNLMDGTLQLSVVSSNSLVSTNSNGDGMIGGDNLSLNLGDSDRDSRETVAQSSVSKSSIGEGTIAVGTIQEGGVSFGGSHGSHCQQNSCKKLHCSSVVALAAP